MIVPVWLHHNENPEREILVYALLDDQSDTTFILETALDQLGVEGHNTQLSLSTLHAEGEVIKSHKKTDLRLATSSVTLRLNFHGHSPAPAYR